MQQTLANPFEIILQQLAEIKEALPKPGEDREPIEVIDRKQLMQRLSITEPTAIRWGKRGRIPELRIGSNVRYNWPEVVAALNEKP